MELDDKDYILIEYLKKTKLLKEDSSYSLILKIRTFRTSFSIYSENYRVLQKTIQWYYRHDEKLSKNHVRRWRIQRMVAKDIHNLISSAHSYIEHISKAKNPKGIKEKINKEFEMNSLYHFIRALRNFLLHTEPLSLISRKEYNRIDSGEINSQQYESFDKTKFLKYLSDRTSRGLNEKDKMAINYLNQFPNYVNLNKVINDFDGIVRSLQEWLVLGFVAENKQELKGLLNNIDELHNYASTNGLTPDKPLTQVQLRHLNQLLRRCEPFQ